MLFEEATITWYHTRCMIGNVFVRIDIAARSISNKEYILYDIFKVDILLDETTGIESICSNECYMISEISGEPNEVSLLKQIHSSTVQKINVRQHKIDNLVL